jgi:enterobacteria phage integrase
MPRKLPPHVERNRVKNKNYYSFRIGKGRRTRLPDDLLSEEFRVAYAAAMAGDTAPAPRRDQPGTIGALIASYMRSAGFIRLRDTSKKGYMTRLERIRTDHGTRSVSGVTRERIITGILQPYGDRPAAALDTLKKLRILIRHAIEIGWLNSDPPWASSGRERRKSGHGPMQRWRHLSSDGRSVRSSARLLP